MLFFILAGRPRFCGSVDIIAPAWNCGPELIRCTSEYSGVFPVRWLSHALADGYTLVCPD